MTGHNGEALPITIRNVTKTYGATHALDDVSLDVRSGEFLTLLGPSGSGKTTLLMVLAGFARPDRGSLRFGDREVIRTPPHRRDVGMTFQSYALFPHMTVAGNVGYPLKLRGTPRPERAARVEDALETVRLGGFGDRRVDQLSGGQRQRVAVARAIVFEPRILLMDEPLSALDKKLRDQMQLELRRLHDKLGMTTVYVTHDQREALTMSDRIAVIDRGRIMQIAAPQDLYERPANRFVADFIGESTFLEVVRRNDRIFFGDMELRLVSPAPAEGKLLLMVRPERFVLSRDGPRDGANNFPAVAEEVAYQGDSFLLHARLADGAVAAVRGPMRGENAASPPSAGEALTLCVAPADAALIEAGEA